MKPADKFVLTVALAALLTLVGQWSPAGFFAAAPIPHPGLKVLVVYESEEVSSLTKEQAAILTGTAWQQAVTDAGGEWRVLDDDAEFNDATDLWKAALERPSEHLPRVIVSNHPRGGYEGPLPENNAAMLALLREWGAK